MVIREARKDEAPEMMNYVRKMIRQDHDFYDIVGVRIHAETRRLVRNRLKDPYTLVGLIDGEWVGFANGRLVTGHQHQPAHHGPDARCRIGAIMYYAKAQYAFEILGNKEWWATYESYNGWKRWGLGMAQPSYPWPDVQHELGGARVFYVTKEYWDTSIKNYVRQMVGADLNFDVDPAVLEANQTFRDPRARHRLTTRQLTTSSERWSRHG